MMKLSRWMPVILILISSCCSSPRTADLILRDGKIATVDAAFSFQEAVAVRGDRIIFVGTNEAVEDFKGPTTRVIELEGRLLLPGLIDAHGHLHSLGHELTSLNITGTRSFEEVISLVAERVKTTAPGEWIVGGRWDHNDWESRKLPVHDALSDVSPVHPVYLRRIDGNSAFANRRALEIAGITKETADPFGGVIERKPNGEPSGVLINRAMNLVLKHIPNKSQHQIETEFLSAVESCLAVGLTGIHEAGVGPDKIELYKSLIDADRLPIRVYAMLGEQEAPVLKSELLPYFQKQRLENYGRHFLSVRSIKLFFDGALGSRGAAFYRDYADAPGNNGLLRITPEDITRVAEAALQADMGVNTHCIGIRGNRLCLDAYERALRKVPGRDHRFRIEHAQFVEPEDIEKFARLGVIPSMQPTHCTSDKPFVTARVGEERAAGAYAWRSFLNAGCLIPCGSDFPVESNNPLLGIYAAVTRQDRHGEPQGGWFPEQRMTLEEAVRGFTIWAATAAFQEEVLGSIETGKLADFTVLDHDIFKIDPRDILNTRAVFTIVGGKIRFQRSSGTNSP